MPSYLKFKGDPSIKANMHIIAQSTDGKTEIPPVVYHYKIEGNVTFHITETPLPIWTSPDSTFLSPFPSSDNADDMEEDFDGKELANLSFLEDFETFSNGGNNNQDSNKKRKLEGTLEVVGNYLESDDVASATSMEVR